jgi:Fe-S cluster assembly scaffold protein SufB
MNAHEVQDKTEQRLEVITRIVPVSDERGGATMALSDKANAANAKWATYRKRSGHAFGRNGRMYNPATGQTVKWTNMATVVDKDEDSENYYDVLGINKNEEKSLQGQPNEFI